MKNFTVNIMKYTYNIPFPRNLFYLFDIHIELQYKCFIIQTLQMYLLISDVVYSVKYHYV